MTKGEGRPARIAVVGSANMDLSGRVQHLPRPGETVIGNGFAGMPGGKGANQAVAAARLGAVVEFIACVGDDSFGAELLRSLTEFGVGTQHVRVAGDGSSGVALIGIADGSGENSIMVFPGANSLLGEDDIARAHSALAEADMIVCSLEVPLAAVSAAVKFGFGRGIPVLLNPAPARPLPADLLARLYAIVPNQGEANALIGEENASAAQAAEALRRLGAANVVVTLGAAGALVLGEGANEPTIVPTHRVDKVVDTTAAGDCFSGAFAVAMAEGMRVAEAADFAGAAAALSVTKQGAQSSMPGRAQVESFLASARRT